MTLKRFSSFGFRLMDEGNVIVKFGKPLDPGSARSVDNAVVAHDKLHLLRLLAHVVLAKVEVAVRTELRTLEGDGWHGSLSAEEEGEVISPNLAARNVSGEFRVVGPQLRRSELHRHATCFVRANRHRCRGHTES